MKYSAGDFNRRIYFQMQKVDESNYPIVGEYEEVMKAMACVKNLSAKEFVEARATQSEIITRFVVRWNKKIESTVNQQMIIDYKGRKYEIIAPPINDNDTNETFTFMGKAVF